MKNFNSCSISMQNSQEFILKTERMPKIKLVDTINKEVGSNALNKLVKGTLITSLSRRDKSIASGMQINSRNMSSQMHSLD